MVERQIVALDMPVRLRLVTRENLCREGMAVKINRSKVVHRSLWAVLALLALECYIGAIAQR